MNSNTAPRLLDIIQKSQPSKDFKEGHSIWKTDNCEVFFTEIHEEIYRVPLHFENPVFSNLLNGNKTIQIDPSHSLAFRKNQTLVLPKNSLLQIDFPTSSNNQPTVCTSVTVNPEYIQSKMQFLNETKPKLDREWKLDFQNFSLLENNGLNELFQKLTRDLLHVKQTLHCAWEDHQIVQLLLAIMQQQNRDNTNDFSKKTPSIIQSLVAFIKENPEKSGNLDQLCNQACMSPSTLYRYFKRELGISPIEFIIQQKISKAKNILTSPLIPIKEVSYLSGFEDSNYFIRLFKKHEGITPKQYQKLLYKEC